MKKQPLPNTAIALLILISLTCVGGIYGLSGGSKVGDDASIAITGDINDEYGLVRSHIFEKQARMQAADSLPHAKFFSEYIIQEIGSRIDEYLMDQEYHNTAVLDLDIRIHEFLRRGDISESLRRFIWLVEEVVIMRYRK